MRADKASAAQAAATLRTRGVTIGVEALIYLISQADSAGADSLLVASSLRPATRRAAYLLEGDAALVTYQHGIGGLVLRPMRVRGVIGYANQL